jgi:hypothetical protein
MAAAQFIHPTVGNVRHLAGAVINRERGAPDEAVLLEEEKEQLQFLPKVMRRRFSTMSFISREMGSVA